MFMNPLALGTAFLDGGLRHAHFFNGRLLAAEDLKTEQQATHHHLERLGLAVGDGVVSGLWVGLGVNGAEPTLKVSRGLALNRCGQALFLPEEIELAVVPTTTQQATEAGRFAECQPSAPRPLPAGKGVNLILLCPASGYEGRAPMHGLEDAGRATHCGDRYAVEGVSFRLAPLDVMNPSLVPADLGSDIIPLLSTSNAASLSRLQNLLAHACFGTRELAAYQLDPFEMLDLQSRFLSYGAVDRLRAARVFDDRCVPLALLHWTDSGIQFLDNWAVRRPPAMPTAVNPWPLHVGHRRRIEGEAIFLEFQEHLELLLQRETGLASIEASQRFQFLPPAGYLPVGVGKFNADKFFAGFDVAKRTLDSAFLRLWVGNSWFIEPIDIKPRPLPPLVVFDVPGAPDYVVFARDPVPSTTQVSPPTPASPPDTSSPPTPTTGRFEIEIVFELHKVGDLIDRSINPAKDILVQVQDSLGITHNAALRSEEWLGRGPQSIEELMRRQRWPIFVTGALPFGTYTVRVRAKGFKPVEKERNLDQSRERMSIKLVKEEGRKIVPPKVPIDIREHPSKWWEDVYPLPKLVGWPWPPPEPPVVDPLWDPVPDEIYDDLIRVLDGLRQTRPGLPADPGDIKIMVERGHRPDVVSEGPYAYVVFGDGGAFIPAILTATSQSLGIPTGLNRGGIAGMDRDTQSRLEEAGITNLAMLNGAWTGLVGNALGVDQATAGSLVEESRQRVTTLLDSEAFTMFSGVTGAMETALKASLATRVDLANATPEFLVDLAGAEGMTLGLARRVVAEARNAVPRSAWSLGDADIGLRTDQLNALKANNITTLGDFQRGAADPQGLGDIAGAVGLTTAAVESLATTAGGKLGTSTSVIRIRHKAAAPLTMVGGVSDITAAGLSRAGFTTAGALARLNVDEAAVFFGGDRAAAEFAVNNARASIGI